MSRRRGAVALGAGALLAGWALGTRALVVVGTGLLLTAALSRIWERLALSGLTVTQRVDEGPFVEGDTVRVSIVLRARYPVQGDIVLEEPFGPAGTRSVALRRDRDRHLEVDGLPRGRFRVGPGKLVLVDPLGLVRLERAVDAGPHLIVRPRIPVCHDLFDDRRAGTGGGSRGATRRPTGLEPHGVRDYRDGEPLRAVHWPSTARIGRLMIRELDDGARTDVGVVLDTDARGSLGAPGASTLDDAVRVAGGIVRAHAARGKRVLLVIPGVQQIALTVQGLDATWEAALDVLAGVDPGPPSTGQSLLRVSRDGGVRTHDVVLVTALADAGRADAITALAAAGRRASLVAIDAPTYLGKPPGQPSPSLIRAAAAGVVVTRIRHGDDLDAALARPTRDSAVAGVR